MLMNQAIQRFSEYRAFKVKEQTVRGYDRDLRFFCLYLRNPEIENISLDDVLSYLKGMIELGWDKNTFVGKCMALRKFFEFYRLQGHKVLDPELVPLPSVERKIPRVADEESYKRLIQVIPQDSNDPRHIRNNALIRLLWDTGCRISELLSFDMEDMDVERRTILIKTAKNKGSRPFRHVFWTEETNIYLKKWLEKREYLMSTRVFSDTHAIFVCVTSTHVGERLTKGGLGEVLRRYSNKARIPYVNAHSFRHRVGHEIIKRGGSTADVMNILGHASVQSTTVYTMMAGTELEDRYKAIFEVG